MYFVYILRLKNERFYIGQTNNLEERIKRHNAGGSKYTRKFLPARLIYSEIFNTRSAAMNREKYLKSLKSKKVLRKIIGIDGDEASSSIG